MARKCQISAENGGFFGGSGGSNLQNQKIRVCYHKTQLLSVITYPLTIKINLDNTVRKCVSPPPSPPLFRILSFLCNISCSRASQYLYTKKIAFKMFQNMSNFDNEISVSRRFTYICKVLC